MSMGRLWGSLREQAGYAAYATGWGAVKKLPEGAADRLFTGLADAAVRRRGKGVLRLEANLRRVCPEADDARLAELVRAGMRSYMRYWKESFRMSTWSRDRIQESLTVQDVHLLDDNLAAGRGVVLALPHMGNWDLAGAWVVVHGCPFTTVAERLKPERLFDAFVAYRESLGMEVLPLTGGANTLALLARRLRAGGLVCLVGDRDLSATGVEVDFMGEAARMPPGPAALAIQTGAALLPVSLWYDGTPVMRGRVHPEIPVPAEGSRRERTAAMTQSLADVWAAAIREHPQDWHMLQRFWLADLPGGHPARPAVGKPRTAERASAVRPSAAEDAAGERPAAGDGA